MNRSLLFVALLSLLFGISACDGSSSDTDDESAAEETESDETESEEADSDETESEETESEETESEEEESQEADSDGSETAAERADGDERSGQNGDDEQADVADGELESFASEITDIVYGVFSARSELIGYNCSCNWEEQGHASESACREQRGQSDEELSGIRDCAEETLVEYGVAPPDSVREVFECFEEGLQEARSCIDDVQSDHSDLCTDQGQAAIGECQDDLRRVMSPGCEDFADGSEGETWMDETDDLLEENECFPM